MWDRLYNYYQAHGGALVELCEVTDAYCLIGGGVCGEVLQETRQAFDDLQVELYLLEQELIRRKVVKLARRKLVNLVVNGGLHRIQGRRWPGQRVSVTDFSYYLRVSQPAATGGAVHVRTAKRNQVKKHLRTPWLGGRYL